MDMDMDTWMEWDRQAYGRKNDRQKDIHTGQTRNVFERG